MARNEEKSHSMLNRWLELQKEEAGIKKPKQRRPYLAELCTNVAEAERWRMQVIKEISKSVLHIQNVSLDEHKIRDLNDRINKLIREKTHWEHRIKELGGADRFGGPAVIEEGEEGAIRAPGGYYYFGAAKNLPGVQELLAPKQVQEVKRTRYDMYQGVNADYYGFRDDEDGILEIAEAKAERKAREVAILDWEMAQIEKYGTTPPPDQEEEELEVYDSDDNNHPAKKQKTHHKSHVPLPSDEEIEQILLERRKQELVRKYLS